MSFVALDPVEARGRRETVKITGNHLFALSRPPLPGARRVVSIARPAAGMWKDHLPNAMGSALRAPPSGCATPAGRRAPAEVVTRPAREERG
ncbi:hypothetical protein [Streptosporangium lutulentum]|uniref:Uncharacterized protein n=1 Tax=Streptosporangium lutulentum TaxID=1461250 RepID=A0ABT9Q351_9ACTN|nr:hypothetical protein [Streptosporangium lutulentum]MDP9841132.1 hypothetical protein [Streptosporangium lutulentum]